MPVITYHFGNYFGVLLVKDWATAFECMKGWPVQPHVIRIKYAPIA